jgi:1-acyl-sn-glycerol-3-phosphate acyltransferase
MAELAQRGGATEPGERRATSGPGRLGAAWRVASRFALGIGATIALSLLWFGGLPFARGRHRRHERWSDFLLRTWARAMLRATRIRVTVTGTPPAGPCFLVANHLGYVDVFVIAAHVDCRFVAIEQMARWPLFGFMSRRLGTIFIDRSRKRDIPAVNVEIERAFQRGHVVVIFPEGRQSCGASVLPFRSALLEPAARNAHPVAWATLGYATTPGDPPASQSVAWVGCTLLRHARDFLALRRVEATLTFGAGLVRSRDRKQLADELHAHVAAAFRPLE